MNLESREVEEQYVLRVKDPALAEQLRCTATCRRLQSPLAASATPRCAPSSRRPFPQPHARHTLQGGAAAAAGAGGPRHQQRPAAVSG
jgi:hypothetical protein